MFYSTGRLFADLLSFVDSRESSSREVSFVFLDCGTSGVLSAISQLDTFELRDDKFLSWSVGGFVKM